MPKDKPGQSGGLEHAVFRIADAQAAQAKALERFADELAKWRELAVLLIEKSKPETEGN